MSKTETLPLTPLNKHIDALCKSLSFGNLGHTPRPSPAEKAYIQGMRDASQVIMIIILLTNDSFLFKKNENFERKEKK